MSQPSSCCKSEKGKTANTAILTAVAVAGITAAAFIWLNRRRQWVSEMVNDSGAEDWLDICDKAASALESRVIGVPIAS